MDENERISLGREILRSQSENLWPIGTVGLAPHPVIVKNTLRNIPEKGLWCFDTEWGYIYHPEQFFFKNP